MTSGCLDRKEVRGAIWGVHSTTDRTASGNTGRLFLTFGGPVCADRFSNCPLDRVLTYKNLIYLLNLQISKFTWLLLDRKKGCVAIYWPSLTLIKSAHVTWRRHGVRLTTDLPALFLPLNSANSYQYLLIKIARIKRKTRRINCRNEIN